MVCVLSSFKYAGVSAFHAKGEDVEGDVGTSLIDNTDDSERNADALKIESVRQDGVLLYLTERTWQLSHFTGVGSNAIDALTS